ncbi:MAG TPA: DNA gyrase subunit A [Pirellulales bacterium]|nr:DNA gyrase subunit A [Pirellulales bacterium]
MTGKVVDLPIEQELKDSYLTYAMSVIVSRALPDVRDGLKPSQRRILAAMNDLRLTPGAARVKCAKICGDTSGNYHPHGEAVIYPTLVRMAQEWNMRHVLIDKQGNWGSIAGMPPAAMRYTEARMSAPAAMLLEDLDLDTVDFIPTYDEKRLEPTVLPAKFPNLLVNGANGIAVGMATSIPPHNLGEVCDALVALIDKPDLSGDELLQIVPGPDFPTGGIILSRAGIRRGYLTGRATIPVRARTRIEEHGKNRFRIVVSEIPFQQSRDPIVKRIADLVNEDRVKGISNIRDESDLEEPVRIILELKRDADPEIVLNQLYQFSPLQDSFSLIFLALVDGKPRVLTFKGMLEEFLRHRVQVIRRRTQFLLNKARQRKHVVEGLLLAHANIDEVIRVIRSSSTTAEAKSRLMEIQCPKALMARALGETGFEAFLAERGDAESYSLTAVQAEAILRMTLGQLVNLEQEKLADEYRKLLSEIGEYLHILSDDRHIRDMIRADVLEMRKRFANPRRTEISGEEIGHVDMEDLIAEETMVVSISHNGYIKRTASSVYRAQRRGGKGLTGAKTEDEDPIAHLFVASTHDYLLFFTNRGKVYWQKVYDLPQLSRESRGRAVVNLLNFAEGERIADCRAVRDFNTGYFLMMATRKGLVKKTPLEQYSRPLKGGIIAIKLKDDDELIDVVVTKPGDEVVLSTADGMAIRFHESDARPMGRNTSGVKGIGLRADDRLVGMVVAEPEATLLTACLHGYGKRTLFGPNTPVAVAVGEESPGAAGGPAADEEASEAAEEQPSEAAAEMGGDEDDSADDASSQHRYRAQRRGGKGLRDIKTTDRNGPVIGIAAVHDDDELLMMTARGKIQRIAAREISTIGRNTQGVRIMSLDDDDSLAAIVRVPREEAAEAAAENPPIAAPQDEAGGINADVPENGDASGNGDA